MRYPKGDLIMNLLWDQTRDRRPVSRPAVRLRTATEIPAGDAELVMTINGREHRWAVHIPVAIHPPKTLVPITARAEPPDPSARPCS